MTSQPQDFALALNNSCTSCNTFARRRTDRFPSRPDEPAHRGRTAAVPSAQRLIEEVLQSDSARSALRTDSSVNAQPLIVDQFRATLGSDFTGPAQQDGHQQEQQTEIS